MKNKVKYTENRLQRHGKILVVDDQNEYLQIMSDILAGYDYQIQTASDGEQAIEMVHREYPDLILLDIRMPGMDGFEVCQELKANDQTCDVPIIFISGLEDASDKVKAFQVGGVDYIIKPVGEEELLARVSTQLENQRYRKYLAEEVQKRTVDLEKRTIELEQLITERKLTEQALLESEQRYRTVVEDIPAMICRFLPDGAITFVNNTFCYHFGRKREQLIRQDFFQFIPGENQNELKALLLSLIPRKSTITYYYQAIHPYETTKWHEWTVRALFDEKEHLIEYQSIGRDITEVKQAREMKANLERQLRHSRKLESIGTLAGGIAHDFNNILTPIILRTEMALLDVLDENKVKQNLAQVIQASYRAKELVQQILIFSRQSEQEIRPLKLGPVIKEVMKLIRASIPATIIIQVNIQTDSDTILADPIQIHQILMNISTNAAHAMSHNGGILEIGLTEEYVDADKYPDLKSGLYLKLMVRDTGCGMEPSVLDRIFDPFFTTKMLGEGTGMGLSVVYGIVKSYGGIVTVESKPGIGSVFNVFFPKHEKNSKPTNIAHHKLPKGTESILLVDDEVEIVDVVHQMLMNLGYRVESYSDSVIALHQFKKKPDKFDIVITDQTMPGMTGEALAKNIMGIRADIPIILCTGFSNTITEEKAKTLGIKEFVMKPIIMSKMATTIRRALDQ